MPYVFPHENLFVLGVGGLILGLLAVRVWLARRRRAAPAAPAPEGKPDETASTRSGD
nr:hypothetical protein [Nitrospirota bacterium]